MSCPSRTKRFAILKVIVERPRKIRRFQQIWRILRSRPVNSSELPLPQMSCHRECWESPLSSQEEWPFSREEELPFSREEEWPLLSSHVIKQSSAEERRGVGCSSPNYTHLGAECSAFSQFPNLLCRIVSRKPPT